jgi:hypothetical protein
MENLEIDDFEIVEQPEISGAFKVDDDLKADWAMRKLASIRRKQSQNKTIFDAEVQRVQEWLEKVNTALERDSAYFEAVLTQYALLQRLEGRKSVVLPHGTVKTTAGRPKIEIESSEEFITWAQANAQDLLRIKTEVDKKALNALPIHEGQVISTTGEIIPSVKVIPAEPSVSFDISE